MWPTGLLKSGFFPATEKVATQATYMRPVELQQNYLAYYY